MPPNNSPLTTSELLSIEQENREKRLYPKATREATDDRISALVAGTAQELADAANRRQRFSLDNLEAVQQQTQRYFEACEQSATVPCFSGLARSFGLSREALNKHLRNHPDSATSEWLRLVHDAMADTLAAAALRGSVQPVVAIFALKARSGWKDTFAVEIAQPRDPLGPQIDPDTLAAEIAERYAELPE